MQMAKSSAILKMQICKCKNENEKVQIANSKMQTANSKVSAEMPQMSISKVRWSNWQRVSMIEKSDLVKVKQGQTRNDWKSLLFIYNVGMFE